MSISRCPKMGKVCFDNEDKAQADANRIFKDKGVLLETYKCPFCRNHHLTKKCNSKQTKPYKTKTTYLYHFKDFEKYLAV